MNFNKHFNLAGRHAELSPSKYHWVNYDPDKMQRVFAASMAAKQGDELHALAAQAIKLGVKFAGNGTTISRYVNDAIGYRMTAEQTLYYSDNCFGHADAISFRKNLLRIHDLKTGVIPASIKQLEVYAALFCLEYDVKPFDIRMELRIYQLDDTQIWDGDPAEVTRIMSQIIMFDRLITTMRMEAQA